MEKTGLPPLMRFSGLMLKRKPGTTGSRATIQDWKILAISTDDPMASQLCLGQDPGCQASNFPCPNMSQPEITKSRFGGNDFHSSKDSKCLELLESPMASRGHFLSHESHGGPVPQVQREWRGVEAAGVRLWHPGVVSVVRPFMPLLVTCFSWCCPVRSCFINPVNSC